MISSTCHLATWIILLPLKIRCWPISRGRQYSAIKTSAVSPSHSITTIFTRTRFDSTDILNCSCRRIITSGLQKSAKKTKADAHKEGKQLTTQRYYFPATLTITQYSVQGWHQGGRCCRKHPEMPNSKRSKRILGTFPTPILTLKIIKLHQTALS